MEYPFIIRLPSDLSKNRRRKIRMEVIEHMKSLDIDVMISEKKIDAIRETMEASPHPLHVLTPSIDKDGNLLVAVESRAVVEENKRNENLQKMHKFRRRMAMKRSKNRPASWTTFFRLSGAWPDKLQNIMPLDDPDDVAAKKIMYLGTIAAMRSMNIETKNFKIWTEYIESCL